MIKINPEEIKIWMDEKYKFWKNSTHFYSDKEESFWRIHPIAELPKRIQHLNILVKYIKDPSSTTVVDVGIAGGMFPFLLHKLGINVIGLDWGGITSQEDLEKLHPGVKVYACYYEKERWPLQDNSVDIVTLLDVIEHVHPPQQFMFKEIKRILKPGGILIVTTPNIVSLRKRIWALRGCHPVGQLKEFFESNPFVAHIREFTVSEVSLIVKWAGFEVISAYCINHIYYMRYAEASAIKKIILKMYKFLTLLKNDLKDTVVVEARKPFKR